MRMAHYVLTFVALGSGASIFAADCPKLAKAKCKIAAACQWDDVSKSCVEKSVDNPDDKSSGDGERSAPEAAGPGAEEGKEDRD
jgi:hypothetical protein